jgi:hypothetical protein
MPGEWLSVVAASGSTGTDSGMPATGAAHCTSEQVQRWPASSVVITFGERTGLDDHHHCTAWFQDAQESSKFRAG